MVVETKYMIGDDVWFMSRNHICCASVNGVFITHNDKTDIMYELNGYECRYSENELFESKDKLKKNLYDECGI